MRAQESGQHKETWEGFEQEWRLKRVENTKTKSKLATKTTMHGTRNKEVKKRSHWKMELSQIAEDENESKEEGDIIEDWRAKIV